MIPFQNTVFPEEFPDCSGFYSSYLPKLNSSVKLVPGAHFLDIFP